MAGDWIKMRGNLWDDPRVARLCDITDKSEAAIVGGLYWLWATADQHTEDGVMPGMTLRAIDRKTGINGFGDALVSIGWVEDRSDGILIVNFEEHNGASAKRRSLDAKRKAVVRTDSACDADKARKIDGQNAPLRGAREEKRREDISTAYAVESAPKKKASRRCPEDFELTEPMREWAVINAPAVDVDLATAKFKDHTFKTGITDWKAAWRNWLRNEQQFNGTPRAAAAPIRETFKERDERLARQKWEQVTGRKSNAIEATAIDITPAAIVPPGLELAS